MGLPTVGLGIPPLEPIQRVQRGSIQFPAPPVRYLPSLSRRNTVGATGGSSGCEGTRKPTPLTISTSGFEKEASASDVVFLFSFTLDFLVANAL